jgi:hypothetical protein
MMLEVRGMAQKVDNSYVNRVEAMSALSLVDLLVHTESATASEITLLCLYKAQAEFLQAWEHKPEGLGVATLDAFQGRENQIILFLTTRMVNSSSAEAISFLDRRRWNVALSRCKKGVVVMIQKTALEKNTAAREWWCNELNFPFLPTTFTNLEVVCSEEPAAERDPAGSAQTGGETTTKVKTTKVRVWKGDNLNLRWNMLDRMRTALMAEHVGLHIAKDAAPKGQNDITVVPFTGHPDVVRSAVEDFRTQLAGFELAPFPYLMKVYMGNTANTDLRIAFTEFLQTLSAVLPSSAESEEHWRWQRTTSPFYEHQTFVKYTAQGGSGALIAYGPRWFRQNAYEELLVLRFRCVEHWREHGLTWPTYGICNTCLKVNLTQEQRSRKGESTQGAECFHCGVPFKEMEEGQLTHPVKRDGWAADYVALPSLRPARSDSEGDRGRGSGAGGGMNDGRLQSHRHDDRRGPGAGGGMNDGRLQSHRHDDRRGPGAGGGMRSKFDGKRNRKRRRE